MLPGRGTQRRIIIAWAGVGLLIGGIFLLPIPGLNLVGILFIIIGLALIARGTGVEEFDRGGG